MKRTFIAIHNHNYGVTVILFKSKHDYISWYGPESEPKMFKHFTKPLGIDFEPKRNESLEVIEIDTNDIKEIPWQML